MTVTRWGILSETGHLGVRGERTVKQVWQALTDNQFDGVDQILDYPDCPYIGQPYRGNLALTCRSVDPARVPNNKYLWNVDVNYETSSEEGDDQENPLLRPPKISFSRQTVERDEFKDRDGKPIANTAGEPIHDVKRHWPQWLITIRRNVASVPDWLLDVQNVVNSDTVRLRNKTFRPGLLQLTNIQIGEEQIEARVKYSELTIEMLYDRRGFARELLNQGFSELMPVLDPRTRQPVLDPRGQPVLERKRILTGTPPEPIAEPVFLDKLGRQPRNLAGDARPWYEIPPKIQLDPEDIVVLPFHVDPEFRFNSFPLS